MSDSSDLDGCGYCGSATVHEPDCDAPAPAPEPEGFTCRCCGSDVPTPFPVDYCGWCRGSM